MLHHREGEKLDEWLAQVTASHIREFQSCVVGVQRDKAAVVAGLTLPENNGLVEGKVKKLKLIKRLMYGRAKFPRLASARAARLGERNLSPEKRELLQTGRIHRKCGRRRFIDFPPRCSVRDCLVDCSFISLSVFLLCRTIYQWRASPKVCKNQDIRQMT